MPKGLGLTLQTQTDVSEKWTNTRKQRPTNNDLYFPT